MKGFSRFYLLCFVGLLSISFQRSNAQVLKHFVQRTSVYTPTKSIYNIKGDFVMLGNTNLTLQNYSATQNNGGVNMVYVDVDGVDTTLNSSSAELKFSTENGAIPACSKIIYAGLYWTGRAHDGTSPTTFSVSKTVPGSPQTVNSNFTVSHNGMIENSTYTMAVSRVGSGSTSRYVRYTFTSSGNPTVLVEFNNTPAIRYSYDAGSTWTIASSQSFTNSGDLRTATFSPITIFNQSGGILLTISSLVRDSRTNQAESVYQSTATAKGNVSGTSTIRTITKNFSKQQVSLRGPGASSYTQIAASPNDIYYPNTSEGYMFSAYAEVTDYVRAHGIGNYTVADIALNEGNGGGTGFYGGWGMIVVYENAKMKWRDITIFDGHAYIASSATQSYEMPISGFHAAQVGDVNVKLGVMAGEGDVDLTGEYLDIQELQTSNFIPLSHSQNTTNNFFNSSINTGGNIRNPNLLNNTGLDIAMFNIPNTNNSIIANNQTSTKFRYGTNSETYIIFCLAMGIDAYIPEIESFNTLVMVNGLPPSSSLVVNPGDVLDYQLFVRNKGTEAINNVQLSIPVPYTSSFISTSSENFQISPSLQPVFNPAAGATGSIQWSIPSLPLLADKDELIAVLSYQLKVTENCFILSNTNCIPAVAIDGDMSGVGAVSGTVFTAKDFVQAYVMEGTCFGDPITTPVLASIDRSSYLAQNCSDKDYSTQSFYFCNVIDKVPFIDVTGNFPPGCRYYNSLTVPRTEYTVASGFPPTSGVYYAVTPGSESCYFRFTINVNNITTSPTVADVGYCRGQVASPLTATPTNPSYNLYYYTSQSGGTPLSQITPSTSVAGQFEYWVAEGLSGQCIGTGRSKITFTVNALQASPISGEQEVCPNSVSEYTMTPVSGSTYTWFVPGDPGFLVSTYSSSAQVHWGGPGTYDLGLIQRSQLGCMDTTRLQVVVKDQTPPSLQLPQASLTMACFDTTVLMNWAATAIASDICSGVVPISYSYTRPADACNQQMEVSFTAIDEQLNQTLKTAIVYIKDSIAPVFTAFPSDTTVSCSQIPILGTVSTSDNCTPSVIPSYLGETKEAGASTNQYTLKRKWSVTDGCGMSRDSIQTIQVIDTIAAVFINTPPTHLLYSCSAEVPSPSSIQAVDLCTQETFSVNMLSEEKVDSTCLFKYTLLRKWVSTDGAGNTANFTQTIVVKDTIAPVITQLPAIFEVAAQGQAGKDLTIPIPEVSDNCGLFSLTNDKTGTENASATYPIGMTHVRYEAVDSCGNIGYMSLVVTVIDEEAPIVVKRPEAITVSCEGDIPPYYVSYQEFATAGGLITDNNAIDEGSFTHIKDSTDGNLCPKKIAHIYKISDFNGYTTEFFTVTIIKDSIAPVFTTTPADITISIDDLPLSLGSITATDDCGNTPTIEFLGDERVDGSCINSYEMKRKWRAVDDCGNFSTYVQNITVEDRIAPSFSTAAKDTLIYCDGMGEAQAVEAWLSRHAGAVAIDNAIGDLSWTNDFSSLQEEAGVVGTALVRFIVEDVCGNKAETSARVTVKDETPPYFIGTLPADTLVDIQSIPTPVSLTAKDACSNANVLVIHSSQDTVRISSSTLLYYFDRVWEASDTYGNKVTHKQRITVQDTLVPFIIFAAEDITFDCDGQGNVQQIQDWLDRSAGASATDNSGSLTWSHDYSGLTSLCGGTGITNVTFTARDASGNESSTQAIVLVQDTSKPYFTDPLPASITVDCHLVPNAPILGAADQCGLGSNQVVFEENGFDTLCVGTYSIERIWTVTDPCGNSTSHRQLIHVQDTSNPVFVETLPSDTTVRCDQVPEAAVLTATDACTPSPLLVNFTEDTVEGVCVNSFMLSRVWEVEDACGNLATHTQKVYVIDTMAPEFVETLPSDGDYSCDNIPSAVVLTAIDQGLSTLASVEFQEDIFNFAGEKQYLLRRSWLAKDQCANTRMYVQNLLINDLVPPVFQETLPQDTLVDCSSVPLNAVLTALDNCVKTPIVVEYEEDREEGNCPGRYTLVRTWTASDDFKNSTSHTQTISVQDTTKPSFVEALPKDTVVSYDRIPAAAVLTALDDCMQTGPEVIFLETKTDSSCVYRYTLNRKWTATDACDNQVVHIQKLVVQDLAFPIFVEKLPADTTVSCDSLFIAPVLTAKDSTGALSYPVTYSELKEPGDCPFSYILKRKWQAKEECGNLSSHTQIITVVDRTYPKWISSPLPSDTTVEYGSEYIAESLYASHPSHTTTIKATLSEEKVPGSLPHYYELKRTWTAFDSCGNTIQHKQSIHVQDTTKPSNIKDSILMNLPTLLGNCEKVYVNNDPSWNVSASDIGGIKSIVYQLSGALEEDNLSSLLGIEFPVGLTYLNCVITDSSDNSIAKTYTIEVLDNSMSADIQVLEPVHCYGKADGVLYVTVEKGVQPYVYEWSVGAETSDTLRNLGAGSYSVQVTDAIGCILKVEFEMENPTQLKTKMDMQNSNLHLCDSNASNAIMALVTTGGTPYPGGKYLYSVDGSEPDFRPIFDSLSKGVHHALVQDQYGCSVSLQFYITVPSGAPLSLQYAASYDSILKTCDEEHSTGRIHVDALHGAAPYLYAISADGGITYSPTTDRGLFDNLAKGAYRLRAVDSLQCEAYMDVTIEADQRANLVVQKWHDVLLVDNKDRHFKQYQWIKNGVEIAGASAQYYSENNGFNGVDVYHVKLVDKEGQTFYTCPFLPIKKDPIELYPVPVQKGKSIQVRTGMTERELMGARAEIIDVQGKILEVINTVKPVFSIQTNYSPGTYMLRLSIGSKVLHLSQFVVVD